MPDKTEPRTGGRLEAPAEEPTPEAPAAKPPASGKTWLPLLITVVAMPMLAYATTKFVLVPQMKRALAQSTAAPVESAAATGGGESHATASDGKTTIDGKTKVTVPLSKILVNVAGTMGTRYLMTSVTLVGTDPNLKNAIDQNKDQLLDLATGTLCTKTIADLEKPGARNVIRAELMTIFNNALGGPVIKEIYITELAIQ
ncbi:MAG: flagellar basal body-associated FliL family protein [Verrucomicrobiota bacterium]|jgi:flagellar FliL protein